MKARGFVMQASYRIRDAAPVVHLYGRLEGGATFLVRDARQTPCFYVRTADAMGARECGATRTFNNSGDDRSGGAWLSKGGPKKGRET